MAETPADDSTDQGLQELLAVERRLQHLVQQAKDEAGRHVAEARTACERRVIQARHDAERTDAERARAETVVHAQALSEIDAANQAVLAELTRISDERIDELARRALALAVAVEGDLT
jgi:hypothetical protein